MRATVIGATGLIGSHLLELLLADDNFDSVTVSYTHLDVYKRQIYYSS